ncbi:MAG: hypothetical protein K2R98_09640, partial [Gemmataceae bacterium]|nr:hypothetical protein [Gemmataceae bacterium]
MAIRLDSGGLRRFLALLLGVVALLPVAAADKPSVAAEQVRELQAKYKAEREAAVGSGVAGRFAPDCLRRADAFAKKGDAALAAGRFQEAAEAFREARWLVPAVPADFPEHVARVFGNPRGRHGDWIDDLAFTTDGARLATVSRDGVVKIWDAATGREVRSCRDLTERLRTGPRPADMGKAAAVAWSQDGKSLASAVGKDIKVWDPETGKEVRTLQGHASFVTAVAFAPDGKTIASGGLDQTVRTWDAESGKEAKRMTGTNPNIAHNGPVSAVSFSPDGVYLASVGGDGAIRVWTHANGANALSIVIYNNGSCYGMGYAHDGKSLAVCGKNGPPKTYAAPTNPADPKRPTGTLLANFQGHAGSVGCVAFSKDGKLLATGGSDKTIRLWDVASGESIRVLYGHLDEVTGVAFHPDGQQLASVSRDQTVRFWHLDTVEVSRVLTGHQGHVWSAAFSPDGQRVVSGGADKAVRIWDVVSEKVLRTLEGHKAPVTAVQYSPDAKLILSSGGDEVVKLWNADKDEAPRDLVGHKGPVMAAMFDKDGKRVISGGADRFAKVWDVATGKEAKNLSGHSSIVSAVAFHPNRNTAA